MTIGDIVVLKQIFLCFDLVIVQPTRQRAPNSLLPLRNNSNISIIPRGAAMGSRGPKPLMRMMGANRGGKQPIATARPYFGEGSPVTVSNNRSFLLSELRVLKSNLKYTGLVSFNTCPFSLYKLLKLLRDLFTKPFKN